MRKFLEIRVVAFAALITANVAAQAQPATVAEPEIKAAFIYNFAKFIEWPTNATDAKATFDIGVVGAPEVAEAIEKVVSGKMVESLSVAVRRFSDISGVEAASSHLRILFVGSDSTDAMPDIREALGGLPVLTVGDSEAFWKAGGAIDFLVQDGRMRFRINLETAKEAGLKISGKLLALASSVERSESR